MIAEGVPDEAKISIQVAQIRRRMAEACEKVGRSPDSVTLVAVTKTVEPDAIRGLIAAGVKDVAENRLQTAEPKFAELAADFSRQGTRRHFIGHLQTNKAAKVLRLFSFIHSVDSAHLAQALNARLTALKSAAPPAETLPPIPFPCLAEVNVSGEERKQGLPPKDLREFLARSAEWPCLSFQGLMTMAPLSEEMERARPVFRGLRELLEQVNAQNWSPAPLRELSMGMSQDYPVAIEEGATMVRIGSALFEA
jgi:hypothetical protein